MSILDRGNSDCWYPHIWVFPDDAQSLVVSVESGLDFQLSDKLDIQASALGIEVQNVYHFDALILPETGSLSETGQSKYTLVAVG